MRKSSPALPTNPNSICPADALPACFPGWAAFFACRSPSPWDRQWLPRRKAFARRCGDEATWGAIAQLGERYNGIVEVSGSIPLSSTKSFLRKIMIFRLRGAKLCRCLLCIPCFCAGQRHQADAIWKIGLPNKLRGPHYVEQLLRVSPPSARHHHG